MTAPVAESLRAIVWKGLTPLPAAGLKVGVGVTRLYVAEATPLAGGPLIVAIADRVSEMLMGIGPVYRVEAEVGGVPSVV
jgi:hypothetical protein